MCLVGRYGCCWIVELLEERGGYLLWVFGVFCLVGIGGRVGNVKWGGGEWIVCWVVSDGGLGV